MAVEGAALAVARVIAEERYKRKEQEFRVRCYAEVLAIYAHRLAIATDENPQKVIMRAREEVQQRLKDKDL